MIDRISISPPEAAAAGCVANLNLTHRHYAWGDDESVVSDGDIIQLSATPGRDWRFVGFRWQYTDSSVGTEPLDDEDFHNNPTPADPTTVIPINETTLFEGQTVYDLPGLYYIIYHVVISATAIFEPVQPLPHGLIYSRAQDNLIYDRQTQSLMYYP